MKNYLFAFLTMIMCCNLNAQILATTNDGDKVKFDKTKKTWEYVETIKDQDNRIATSDLNPDTFKSFTTSNGEISSAELRSIYLSDAPDKEITSIVDEIYTEENRCNCTVCSWPSHCTWGSSCSYQRNIPCGWCCP